MARSAVITGVCGLVGFSAAKRLINEGYDIHGIDNDGRARFFGREASTIGSADVLKTMADEKGVQFVNHMADISDAKMLPDFPSNTKMVIHTAAQPSHDWAATNIVEDFHVNAVGTLNVLEKWRTGCPKAVFIHVSTSKVYGDNPNMVKLTRLRGKIYPSNSSGYRNGFHEKLSVDQCLHSFFGVSKLSGDLLAQEYGRNLMMPIGIFRPGCVTGGHHKGVEQHGFLNYLMHCVKHEKKYTIYGYGGCQMRDNVHAEDLVEAFLLYAARPQNGAVYNIGGKELAISIRHALLECEKRCGKKAIVEYCKKPRRGDHMSWMSNSDNFRSYYGWEPKWTLAKIFDELYAMA